VTTSSEELGDMRCGWAVSELLVDGRSGLKCCSDHGAGFGAASRRRCAERSNVGASGNERRRKSGGLLDPLGTEWALCIRTDPFGRVAGVGVANEVEALNVVGRSGAV
jgi:hypothetical protein